MTTAREQLINARKQQGWTQEHAAEQLDVSPATVKRWEAGQSFPHPSQVRQLEKVYNRSIGELGFINSKQQKEIPMTDHLARSMDLDLTGKIIKLVWSWTGGQYQDLQSQISQEIRAYKDIPLTRRQALTSVILLPIGMQAAAKQASVGEQLAQIAAGITACWHERRGTDLQTAHDATSIYITQLQNILPKCTERQRQAAAEMIMQCYILKGALTRHLQGNEAAFQPLQQALQYSDLTRNSEQKVLAIRTIAATHAFADNKEQAFLYGAQAAAEMSGGNLLMQSYVHCGLASFQSTIGKRKEALSSLDQGYEAFSNQSSEIAPVWVDHNQTNIYINTGKTFVNLGEFQKAAEVTDKAYILTDSITDQISALFDRVNIELCRDDRPRDQEIAISLWNKGLSTAREIGSKQLLKEAKAAYQLMRAAWPADKSIKDLKEQLH